MKHFNPHSHAGSDPDDIEGDILKIHFNPHSHAGSDTFSGSISSGLPSISIHTPTQGVTESDNDRTYGVQISIHTPTQGVTSNSFFPWLVTNISIHTPTQGVTRGKEV